MPPASWATVLLVVVPTMQLLVAVRLGVTARPLAMMKSLVPMMWLMRLILLMMRLRAVKLPMPSRPLTPTRLVINPITQMKPVANVARGVTDSTSRNVDEGHPDQR